MPEFILSMLAVARVFCQSRSKRHGFRVIICAMGLDHFPSQTSNIFGLVFSTTGVQSTSSQKSYALYDNGNSSAISINGGQGGSVGALGGTNVTLVDGVYDRMNCNNGVVGLIPSSESTAEVKVVTSPYSAEYSEFYTMDNHSNSLPA